MLRFALVGFANLLRPANNFCNLLLSAPNNLVLFIKIVFHCAAALHVYLLE